MPGLHDFIDGLHSVAKSPYAFVAYVCLLAGFIFYLVSQKRLDAIGRLPPALQKPLLEKEYVEFLASGLTGKEWIRLRRLTLTFWAFVVLIIAAVLLGTIGLLQNKSASSTGTPAQTPTVKTAATDNSIANFGKTPASDVQTATAATTTASPTTAAPATATPTTAATPKPVVPPSVVASDDDVPPLDVPPIVNGGAAIGTELIGPV
jgi:hypothetical protein